MMQTSSAAAPSAEEQPNLRRTALYGEHLALGARVVPFAGFEMPVQYAGILREHAAVRERAGLFDLSHMAQYELRGPGVAAWADTLTVNAIATMKHGQARYNIFTNDRGGCMDDVLFYRLGEERFLLVVNAGNASKMWPYLQEQAAGQRDIALENHHGSHALLAVQGPRAVEIVAPLCNFDAAALKYYFCAEGTVDGVRAVIARTGYTGEDGYELFVEASLAPSLWQTLLARGKEAGLQPAGLGARDMLRLEAGMPLYGFELSEEISPLAGGQGWAVKFDKPAFTGKQALLAQRDADAFERVAGAVLAGKVPARNGYSVFLAGERVGEVRSASLAPSYDNRQIATVLVNKAAHERGTALGIEIRGVLHDATVVPMPFYKRERT
ncbi:MAG: glycine cleavage system aminomethyltransferase GcvT [Candidatus Eremiobacteraeota bacterium]|nr:glycine cleavage system aminomethyltransferase GcvT [Candidatus Eremiobacteraeota bacterium]MBC5802183.1 glycine cleavage system aminomethyltransferase GcvT [Candidatus Eremiobacteraeota bacterium]MBC5821554.1 glycine cleavage system aminomethyltransferase GcvT [Candidatus Eremiobacteraeota bacterium]